MPSITGLNFNSWLYSLKGLNPDFSGVFAYLFTHGLYIFREIWHLAFLYASSVTFMIAFFIQWIVKLKTKPVLKIVVSVSLICIIVVSNGYPLLLGNFAGYLQTYEFPMNIIHFIIKLTSILITMF